MKRTNIYLTKRQDREIERIAEELETSKSEVTRKAVDFYLDYLEEKEMKAERLRRDRRRKR